MSRLNRILLTLALLAGLCASLVQNVALRDDSFDNIAAIAYGGAGTCTVATYDSGGILLRRIDSGGAVRASCRVRATHSGQDAAVAALAEDADGRVYLLKDAIDSVSGEWTGQELEVYDLTKTLFKRVARYDLANDDKVRFRWLSVSTAINLIGVKTTDETAMVRRVYEMDSAGSGALTLKNTRSYQLADKDGIYAAVPAGGNVAYISGSGKLFLATEKAAATEVYPARELTSVMYPLYLAPLDTDTVYIGEQESGNLLTLDLATGQTTVQREGGVPFSGATSYAPVNLLTASLSDPQNFAATVKNSTANRFEILLCQGGTVSVIAEASPRFLPQTGTVLCGAALWAAALFLALRLIALWIHTVRAGRTLRAKLAAASVPMLALALALFGTFSYVSYARSIRASFEKQIIDEGNMLTALFGTESFDEIEYPYDYTGEAYQYLYSQMLTRSYYTRADYYERESMFTGVDADAPCFYPMGIYGSSAAEALCTEAAATGKATVGSLQDAHGARLVCVTPIGGRSGETVYLLETSVPVGSMNSYTFAYLRNYLLVAAAFLVAMIGILMLVFRGALRPLSDIKQGLEQFAQGNRSVRLTDDTTDELSDIIRVFNKMAGDIDLQMVSLRQTNANYYRFIPQRVFALLGGEDLGSLQLGSGIEGEYDLVSVTLHLAAERIGTPETERLTNTFFSILSTAAAAQEAVLLTDSADLRRLLLLCPRGGASAVDLSLSALSQVDALNASIPVQERLEPLFLVHRCAVRYAVCGEPDRLIPTVISPQLSRLCAAAEQIRGLSSRLVVTGSAYAAFDAAHYFHRYIGTPAAAEKETGEKLYDFYDSGTPEEIRLINAGKATFDKALDLYEKKRWYDAKNLFAAVLREDQYDNVARYYVFACEQKLN